MSIEGFPPILGDAPRCLILGSMPGVDSLKKLQYYGHGRNAFWPIITHILGVELTDDYEERVSLLKSNHIAVWDVIKSCVRAGSLDSAIDKKSIVVNDFLSLFTEYPSIEKICFNGALSYQLFTRHVRPMLEPGCLKSSGKAPKSGSDVCMMRLAGGGEMLLLPLPSTSPANARLSIEEKLRIWRDGLSLQGVDSSGVTAGD